MVRIWTNEIRIGDWDDFDHIVCISTLEGDQNRTIRSCEWSPCGNMIACASFDSTVVIWEAENTNKKSWELVASLEGHENEVKCVAWNSDGRLLATCGRAR